MTQPSPRTALVQTGPTRRAPSKQPRRGAAPAPAEEPRATPRRRAAPPAAAAPRPRPAPSRPDPHPAARNSPPAAPPAHRARPRAQARPEQQMRQLCTRARGVADPGLVDLCHQRWG
ncbi:hypothetical protein DVZ84_31390 [Streptomyces parvulus]|uniref:Uncharacterized protein n=1 Tax=Streptomyces parvulus TaxID=146923 RepID=A0A369V3D4_9ACTN|nr:hypothetical protein DVZ84_31390 [Streptomyces parvulus]